MGGVGDGDMARRSADGLDCEGLLDAARSGDAERVARALARDPNMEARAIDSNGAGRWTPLALAIRAGSAPCARLLIEAGADVDARSVMGVTAAMVAAQFGRRDCLELLISAGADLGIKDEDGWTAGMGSARQGDMEALGMLRAAGMDFSERDKSGMSARDHAIEVELDDDGEVGRAGAAAAFLLAVEEEGELNDATGLATGPPTCGSRRL